MAEELTISGGTREEKYIQLIPQLEALLKDETDLIANLANTSAALSQAFGFFWTGFYLVKGDELVLGPFQGPVACTRIKKGKGVCGAAWERGESILVPDVEKFPGHIACSASSKSEVVIPVRDTKGGIIAVLDIDSDRLNDFDGNDLLYLEEIVRMIRY
jgi:L-methionine (R)-S-oxide reductase